LPAALSSTFEGFDRYTYVGFRCSEKVEKLCPTLLITLILNKFQWCPTKATKFH